MSGCTFPEMRRLLMSEVYGQAKYLLAWRKPPLTTAAATSRLGTAGHRAAGLI